MTTTQTLEQKAHLRRTNGNSRVPYLPDFPERYHRILTDLGKMPSIKKLEAKMVGDVLHFSLTLPSVKDMNNREVKIVIKNTLHIPG